MSVNAEFYLVLNPAGHLDNSVLKGVNIRTFRHQCTERC